MDVIKTGLTGFGLLPLCSVLREPRFFWSKMISLLLLITAGQAEISAKVEFYPDSLNESTFHVTKIRNQRSLTASIGSQAELKLFKSGISLPKASV